MANKSATITARIEPKVKDQAEDILQALGIPASNAINMFYKQIILHNGLPFDIKLPENRVLDISKMSSSEVDNAIEKGLIDISNGDVKIASEFFDEFNKEYDL